MTLGTECHIREWPTKKSLLSGLNYEGTIVVRLEMLKLSLVASDVVRHMHVQLILSLTIDIAKKIGTVTSELYNMLGYMRGTLSLLHIM